jgi:hypothetical protein
MAETMIVPNSRPLAETSTFTDKDEQTSCATIELEYLRPRTLGYIRLTIDANHYSRINRPIETHNSVITMIEGAELDIPKTVDWIGTSVNPEHEPTQKPDGHESKFQMVLKTAIELARERLSPLIAKRTTAKEKLSYVNRILKDALNHHDQLASLEPFDVAQKTLPQELQNKVYQEVIGRDLIVEISFDWRILEEFGGGQESGKPLEGLVL